MAPFMSPKQLATKQEQSHNPSTTTGWDQQPTRTMPHQHTRPQQAPLNGSFNMGQSTQPANYTFDSAFMAAAPAPAALQTFIETEARVTRDKAETALRPVRTGFPMHRGALPAFPTSGEGSTHFYHDSDRRHV
jgi:hypothetical protein